MNIIWLLFAHYIGDWGLQSDWLANNKGKYWMVMLAHCMVWAACMCICLEWLGIFAIWKALFLLFGHFVCDEIKCHLMPKKWWPIYPDQVLHIIQCVVVMTN